MAQRKRRRGHRSSGAAAGLTGPPTAPSCIASASHSHRPRRATPVRPTDRERSIWSRRRVLLLNSTYEPLTALPMRRAIVMVICGKADVVHDDPAGPVIHSATRSIVVPSVIQLRVLRPGALPCPRADDPRRADAPRPVLLRLLRRARPTPSTMWCHAAAAATIPGRTAWRAARPATTARATSCSPNWAGRCAGRRCRRTGSTGGCCPRSRNSTRRGPDTSARAPPDGNLCPVAPVAAVGYGLRRERYAWSICSSSEFRCCWWWCWSC